MGISSVTILNEKLNGFPEETRERLADYISEHLDEFEDELRWQESYSKTSSKLADFAQDAREEILAGKAEEFDFDKL